MRVLLFSPVGQRSAIARVTGLITSAMRGQGHSVTLVQTEESPEQGQRAKGLEGVPVISWTDRDGVLKAADRADGVVYQVGDHFGFHRGCLEWMGVLPGTVCLHDFYLGNLFWSWGQQDRARADRVLSAWYGDAGRDFFTLANAPGFMEATADTTPMTEWIASMALAVVTHSSWGVDRVLAACPGPVRVLPLPYEGIAAEGVPSSTRTRGPGDEFIVLTHGWINPNKRSERVIEAIAADDRLRSRSVYRIVGPIEQRLRDRLAARAAELHVRIEITGEVSDADLAASLAQADVVCCLRLPTLEAGSASTIEALLLGKAVIVVDAGFYAELPDSAVLKISPEREVDDLRDRLRSIEADPTAAERLGTAAAEWARATFRADRYATELLDVVRQTAAALPVLDATRFAAQTLLAWGASERTILAEPTVGPLAVLANPVLRREA